MNYLGSLFKITKIKRESGESPERSGHCKWEVILSYATGNFLGRPRRAMIHKSGDLPKQLCIIPSDERQYVEQ
jgi:hypothetical protein